MALVAFVCALSAQLQTAEADEKVSLFVKLANSDAIAKSREAKRLNDIGRVDEAIEAYKAGYVIEPSPRFLVNIAVVCNKARRHEEAVEWIARLKNTFRNFDKESAAHVESLLVETKALLRKQQAEQVSATEQSTASASKPAAQERAPPPPLVHEPVATLRGERNESWAHDPIGWSLTGGGITLAAIGAGLLFNAQSLSDDADNAPTQLERSELDDKAKSRRTIGFIAIGVGAVALTAGIIKLVVHDKPSDRIALIPTRTGAMAMVSLKW